MFDMESVGVGVDDGGSHGAADSVELQTMVGDEPVATKFHDPEPDDMTPTRVPVADPDGYPEAPVRPE